MLKMNEHKRTYLMDFIPNKTLLSAVMFARRMIRQGTPPGLANYRAAKYYHVPVSSVAYYVGQVAGTVKGRKKSGKH
jgi:hypothetical protein